MAQSVLNSRCHSALQLAFDRNPIIQRRGVEVVQASIERSLSQCF